MMKRDPKSDHERMVLDLSPIVDVARSLGVKPLVVYEVECPCGGTCELHYWLGLFHCRRCGKRGNVLALVRLFKGLDEEEALRFLEKRAGLTERSEAR